MVNNLLNQFNCYPIELAYISSGVTMNNNPRDPCPESVPIPHLIIEVSLLYNCTKDTINYYPSSWVSPFLP